MDLRSVGKYWVLKNIKEFILVIKIYYEKIFKFNDFIGEFFFKGINNLYVI